MNDILMGTTIKKIKGKEYLYFVYYDSETNKKKEIYCGSTSNPISKKLALEYEIEKLKKRREKITQKITIDEFELKEIMKKTEK